MATLVGGIGSSHAPSIAFAYDAGHQDRPEWKAYFEAWAPVRAWLRAVRADTVVAVYNDHLNRFQFDAYPTFALGLAPMLGVAREGRTPRGLPDVPGDAPFAWHTAASLVRDEFDPALCQEMTLDHGVMSILPLLDPPPWSLKVVPIAVNVILEPMPTPRRCWRLGEAIARAIDSFDPDRRVVVLATGGLSHQLHGSDFGFTNPAWDRRFMDLIEADPQPLVDASHADYITRGGAESVEMMVWLAMRGALAQALQQAGAAAPRLRRVTRYYEAPMLTGYGMLTLALEPV